MKKFVLVLLLMAGAYAATSEPGGQLFDRVWPTLVNRPALILDFESLSPHMDEREVMQTFRSLDFKCKDEGLVLVDRVCSAGIRKFEFIPAQSVSFHFKDNLLRSVRITLHGRDHPEMVSTLKSWYGDWHEVGDKSDSRGNSIMGWYLTSGVIALSARAPVDDDTSVTWMSRSALYAGFGPS